MAKLTDEEIKVNFNDTGDAYGKSWRCKECGQNQFYTPKPVRCPHTPLSWEVQMKERKTMNKTPLEQLEAELAKAMAELAKAMAEWAEAWARVHNLEAQILELKEQDNA